VREEPPELVDVLQWLNGTNAQWRLDYLRAHLASKRASFV